MKRAVLLGADLPVSHIANVSSWDDPLDPVAITTEAVAKKRQPILRVLHTAECHGAWQFYDDVEPLKGPVILPKAELLLLDSSLSAIKDLPVGWEATRKSSSSSWVRKKASQ